MTYVPRTPQSGPVELELERILHSHIFCRARRSQKFLRFAVEHWLKDPKQPVKEYSIALEVFDCHASYDPMVNATVRVEAGRLRSRLREYYAEEGRNDPLVIRIPKGGYGALIEERRPPTEPLSRLQGVGANGTGHAASEGTNHQVIAAWPRRLNLRQLCAGLRNCGSPSNL